MTLTGAEHYREAQRLLSRASHVHGPDDLRPMEPVEAAHCLALAQTHAALAMAAANALVVTSQYVGDSDEVTDWARAVQPTSRAGGRAGRDERPEFWPPQPGHIWQDRDKDRWICTGTTSKTPYLVCVARQGDDSAEEIWRLHGPMTFICATDPTEVECPF